MVPGFTAFPSAPSSVDVLASQGVRLAWDDPWDSPAGEGGKRCTFSRTDTFCTALVLWCKNVYGCFSPGQGFFEESTTPYPCGVCIGVSSPDDW
jgi:hypothetical protein